MLSLKSTASIVLTGWSGVGKTEQAKLVFDAVFPSWALAFKNPADLPTTAHPFRPMLVISCETSTSGTMGKILSHPDCTFIAVDNLEEFTAALTVLDHGHGAKYDAEGTLTQYGTPFRSVFFDGWTALTEGSKGDARILALAAAGGDKTLAGTAKQNDGRVMSKAAAAEIRNAQRLWVGAGAKPQHKGLLMLSTAHADQKWAPKPGSKQGERSQIGEQLDLPPKAARWLMNNANLCLYLGRILPDVQDINDLDAEDEPDMVPFYFALTRPLSSGGGTYQYDLIKWQDGIIRTRTKWNHPDLGAALLESPLLITPPVPKPSKVPPPAA